MASWQDKHLSELGKMLDALETELDVQLSLEDVISAVRRDYKRRTYNQNYQRRSITRERAAAYSKARNAKMTQLRELARQLSGPCS